MGKRKEKGCRRQILQLDDEVPSHSYASGAVWPSYIPHPDQCLAGDAEEKKVQGNPLSGLLSHYMNSEDEDSDENETPVSGAVESSHAQVEGQSPKRMDVEVADFLKEIDSMKVQEEEESGVGSEKGSSRKPAKGTQNPTSGAAAPAVPMSLWQECIDESSGYTYFWNTMTNEVTWDCPAEHRLYLEALAAQTANSGTETYNATPPTSKTPTAPAAPSVARRVNNRKVADSPAKLASRSVELSPSDDEGKMEPITFYGPSSSNEESSDSESESSAKPSSKRPLCYGPQLPPSSCNSSPIEFGPQLPSELAEADAERSEPSPNAPILPASVETQPEEMGPPSEAEANLDMSAAEAMMQSPQASSPLVNNNEATSQGASSSSSDGSHISGECSAGPSSLLLLSYLDDVDEPDSTTRPHVPPAESESVAQNMFIGPVQTPQVLPTTEDLEPQSLSSPKPSEALLSDTAESTLASKHLDAEDHQLSCEQLPVVTIVAGPVLPSTFYDDEPSDRPPARRGFGFGTEEQVVEVGETSQKRQSRHGKKKKKAISFVKAETLDLTELNRHVAAEWSVATSESGADSPSHKEVQGTDALPVYGPQLPENGTPSVAKAVEEVGPATFIGPLPPKDESGGSSEALAPSEPDPSSDLLDIDDIDEIDRALDLALERKRSLRDSRENGIDGDEDEQIETDSQDLPSDEDKVAQLSLTILERFAHAGITSNSVPHLQTLYVQTKTRLEDWRCGALDSLYLLRCLQDTERETWRRGLHGAVSSSDRDCRANKRLRTNDTFLEPDTTRQSERRRKTASVSPPSCANSVSSSTGPSSFLPLFVEQALYAPPPPPPPTPPPDSPPPPPPDSTEAEDGGSVAETEETEETAKPEELPKSSTSLPAFFTGVAEAESVSPSAETPVIPSPVDPPQVAQPIGEGDLTPPYLTSLVAPAMIARPPVPLPTDDLQMELSSFYSDLTALSEAAPPPAASPPRTTTQADPSSRDSHRAKTGTSAESAAGASLAGTKHAAPASNRKEKKLKKARMAPGLVLKKKNIPSLVEKWRKIKQEQALAESSSDEESRSAAVPSLPPPPD